MTDFENAVEVRKAVQELSVFLDRVATEVNVIGKIMVIKMEYDSLDDSEPRARLELIQQANNLTK